MSASAIGQIPPTVSSFLGQMVAERLSHLEDARHVLCVSS